MKKFKKIAIAIGLPAMLMLGACGYSTTASVTKVEVGSGPFDKPVVKKCIAPGTRSNAITNDKFYSFPVSDRDVDATGQAGSDFKAPTSVTADNAEMSIPITVRFNMVTDCKTLGAFFTKYAQRYGAFLSDDGEATDGFRLMERKLIYDPVDTLLDRLVHEDNWRDLYNNSDLQTKLQSQVQQQIGAVIDTNARGHFFNHFTVLIKKPQPTNQALKDAIAAEQSAVASANSATAKAQAQKAQAEAETATAQAEAAKKRAEIDGYMLKGMSPEQALLAYNQAQAIAAGLNPWQSVIIANGSVPTK